MNERWGKAGRNNQGFLYWQRAGERVDQTLSTTHVKCLTLGVWGCGSEMGDDLYRVGCSKKFCGFLPARQRNEAEEHVFGDNVPPRERCGNHEDIKDGRKTRKRIKSGRNSQIICQRETKGCYSRRMDGKRRTTIQRRTKQAVLSEYQFTFSQPPNRCCFPRTLSVSLLLLSI